MDGRSRHSDNTFVERQWRTVKYQEAHLKACPNVPKAHRGMQGYSLYYNDPRSQQAEGYHTPAEVFHEEQAVVEQKPNESRCAPVEGPESLAGAPGLPT